jgi:hypothetical protein
MGTHDLCAAAGEAIMDTGRIGKGIAGIIALALAGGCSMDSSVTPTWTSPTPDPAPVLQHAEAAVSVSSFETLDSVKGRSLQCSRSGACYQIGFGPAGAALYMLPPLGKTFAPFKDLPKSDSYYDLALDANAGIYVRAGDVVVGTTEAATEWRTLGHGFTESGMLVAAGDGRLYASTSRFYKGAYEADAFFTLAPGAASWRMVGSAAHTIVNSAAFAPNGDLWIGSYPSIYVLAKDETLWTKFGQDLTFELEGLTIDPTGNVFTCAREKSGQEAMYRRASGDVAFTKTTGLDPMVMSPLAFDASGAAFVINADVSGALILYRLAPGATAWSWVIEVPSVDKNASCGALANDHMGHLVLQCGDQILRTRP